MTARPWIKFYPADWRSDPKLRLCSLQARGLWIEMLCLMHEAEPSGHLASNGREVNARQLASLVGVTAKEVTSLLAELHEAGVFSLTSDGVIVSRRMIRDAEKAERDKANGRGGGNPRLKGGVNPPDIPTVHGGDKAQKLEARLYPIQEEALGEWDGFDPLPASTPAMRVVR